MHHTNLSPADWAACGNHGGGILGGDPWSDPPICTLAAISNCTISDNSAAGSGGGLLGCSGTITNCTITGNSAAESGAGGGVYSEDNASPTVVNRIIWGNTGDVRWAKRRIAASRTRIPARATSTMIRCS